MRKLIIFVIIIAFGYWVYKVPLEGHLPKLKRIKSKLIMQISSTAFTNNGTIPEKFTCDGLNINPSLQFSGFPPDTKSLALIMDDPDATNGNFTHWVVYNIPVEVTEIDEGARNVPGIQAKNSAGDNEYVGPCPPSGVHRYYFKIYALDRMLPADYIEDKGQLVTAMHGRILDQAEVMARFGKQ